jgi:hypothetical protein
MIKKMNSILNSFTRCHCFVEITIWNLPFAVSASGLPITLTSKVQYSLSVLAISGYENVNLKIL